MGVGVCIYVYVYENESLLNSQNEKKTYWDFRLPSILLIQIFAIEKKW